MRARLRTLSRETSGGPTLLHYSLLVAAVLALLVLVGLAVQSYAHLGEAAVTGPVALDL